MTFKAGQQVTVTYKQSERTATLLSVYSSPFGPSWTVRYEDGSEGAVTEKMIRAK